MFINAESLHSCVPCGRFFHSAKAPFHKPPQHHKQAYSLIPFHKSQAIAFRVLADAYLLLFFVLKKIQKIANPSMHLLNPHQAPCYFVHSIQSFPCPILHYPSIPLKETSYACGRFFHSDAFRSGRSLLASAPEPYTPLHLHSISHLSPKSKSASHPCPLLQIPSILQNQPSILNFEKLNNTHIPKK